ncbi:succinate dehydrogenase, cytochrome b556 subunit [Thioalkalivibrio sp. K90mix]|jgi:succinate dehydrogenase / fumarate reductase cytochrome b subunit|uniref:succinate dehydrogenase, cytochrome b556 subunit n=1 Tax=Thioalkalivibrio sp. (strain K90mix) TaxID=396595 RepID=UPI000195A324|nr:succinate dehydrogenase, cytochrome b556 subunit [Thioalkalivibrio sp. K90mix]ADC72371.1 succinate dehydrogenase, cytochrome b556 subunit [Thioalkalivibrio sp. K90mix]
MSSPARPVFLDLRKIRLPLNAVVSILHRITGIFLILSIPVLLWLLDRSLASPEGFAQVAAIIGHPVGLALLLIGLWWLLHHLFAGIRFLLMEFGIGEDRAGSLRTARDALYAAIFATLAVWLGLIL